jgi:hypothetical protein
VAGRKVNGKINGKINGKVNGKINVKINDFGTAQISNGSGEVAIALQAPLYALSWRRSWCVCLAGRRAVSGLRVIPRCDRERSLYLPLLAKRIQSHDLKEFIQKPIVADEVDAPGQPHERAWRATTGATLARSDPLDI